MQLRVILVLVMSSVRLFLPRKPFYWVYKSPDDLAMGVSRMREESDALLAIVFLHQLGAFLISSLQSWAIKNRWNFFPVN